MKEENSNSENGILGRQREQTLAYFSSSWVINITERIRKIATIKSTVIVSICGGSSTGKSTQVAFQLMNEIKKEVQILSQDNFICDPEVITKKFGWDHPDCYDLDGAQFVLRQISKHKFCSIPEFSFPLWHRTGYRELEPHRITLFEGLYAALDDLQEYSDLIIYVEMPLYVRMIRRLVRNTYERYTGRDPQLTLESYLERPINAHDEYVRRQRKYSDVIVRMRFSFSDSIVRFNLKPVVIPPQTDEFVYRFMGEDSICILISKNAGRLFFSLEYESLAYFYFPVKPETVTKLQGVDMMSL